MKYLLLSCLLIVACGQSNTTGGSNPVSDTCENVKFLGEHLTEPPARAASVTFRSDCSGGSTVHTGGAAADCYFNFEYSTSSTVIVFDVSAQNYSGAAQCLPIGVSTCSYTFVKNVLTIKCGSEPDDSYQGTIVF